MLTLTRDHKYPVVGLCEHVHFYDVGWGCISGLHPGGLMGDETGAKRCTGMGNSHGDRPQIRDATSTPFLSCVLEPKHLPAWILESTAHANPRLRYLLNLNVNHV